METSGPRRPGRGERWLEASERLGKLESEAIVQTSRPQVSTKLVGDVVTTKQASRSYDRFSAANPSSARRAG